MRVLITFKVGDGKGWNHTRHFDMEPDYADTLKRDFFNHLNDGLVALSGSSYRCTDPDTAQPREISIRFSDILYIEFVPQMGGLSEAHGQVAGKQPITGPLQARLGTSPLQARMAGGGREDE